jgi:hypothetical protein
VLLQRKNTVMLEEKDLCNLDVIATIRQWSLGRKGLRFLRIIILDGAACSAIQ